MTKILKYGITVFVILLIGTGIFSGIYFIAQFSAVYPPIKQYNFSINVNELEKIIMDLVEKDTDLSYLKKDTVGNLENGFAYYMEIEIKNSDYNIEYLVKYCNSKYLNKNKQHSELKLIYTFDRLNNIGGYKTKEKGVNGLLEIFDNEIIVKTMLKKLQKMQSKFIIIKDFIYL